MKGPAPIILVLTFILALAAGALTGGDSGLVDVYTGNATSGTWRLDRVPVDRLVAVVLDQEGLRRLAEERLELRQALAAAEVDFESQVLLVAYMGAMPTGGYAVAINRVQFIADPKSGPGRLSVRLSVSSPDPGSIVTQAFTYPADVVPVSRSAWPEGVLEALEKGDLPVEVYDQDGRDWGPAGVYRSGVSQ